MRKDLALLLLAALAATGWFAAWHLKRDLVASQLAANSSSAARTTLPDSARSPPTAKDQPPAPRSASSRETPGPQNEPAPSRPNFPPKEGDPEFYRRVVEDPKVSPLYAQQQRFLLENQYSYLLKALHLTPAEHDAFLQRLVEKRLTSMDVANVAHIHGLLPNDESVLKGFDQANADTDQAIRALLGDTRFTQYQDFDKNITQWSSLYGVEREIALNSSPLNATQADALLKLTARQPRLFGQSAEAMDAYATSYAEWLRTDLAQASALLSPGQMTALTRHYEYLLTSIQLKAALQRPSPP